MTKQVVGASWPAGAAAGDDDIRQRIAQAAPHPRLFWTADGEEAVRGKLKQDPRCSAVWEAVRVTADHMLGEPPVVYQKEGRRLLRQSREALGRILHLGLAARLTGENRYVERAVAEMKAAAAMPDWNPSHFLDTAEMTLAVAVGYDWLHAALSPKDRAEIREAIAGKGLGPYLAPGSEHGWERAGHNWNQVGHGGMVAGALALLEDNPARAAAVVSRALAGLPQAMAVYDPDGHYPEGPSYWDYGTTYNVVLITVLESALGTDFGLSQRPGFLKTGAFLLHLTGPSGNYCNFSDGSPRAAFSPAMVWFASRTRRPELLWFQEPLLGREIARIRDSRGAQSSERFFPLAVLWAEPQPHRVVPAALHWHGRGANPVAVFRASWTDPNAVYLAVKAGSPGASHGHMDVGSFILEADGVRWSVDLGAQNYHALESRGFKLWDGRPDGDRWRLFRYHNRGHSTLLVDDQAQVVRSQAPITEFSGQPGRLVAVVDLSATYAGQLGAATRRFSLGAGRRVVIEDRLKGGARPANVRWAMVTPGQLQAGGWLEKDGRRLRLEVVAPANAELRVWPADPPHDFDEPNPGISIVGFTAPLAAGEEATWQVVLTPGSAVN